MGETDLTAAMDVVRRQLTLRAVVWDAAGMKAGSTAKLEKELAYFQIKKIDLRRKPAAPECKENYELILKKLKEAGTAAEESLIVTDDAKTAEYLKGQKQPGIAVVFYERDGSGGSVSADMIVQGFEEIGVQFLDRVHKRRIGAPWNILYTERTCVREMTLSDLDDLYVLYEGEGITDYTEPLFERQKEEAYTKNYIDCQYYYYGYGMWVVCDRVSGKLIGRAGIEQHQGKDSDTGFMELGYVIGREYQNRGYATEVCRAILAYASSELQLEELHCLVHRQNQPSIRVAEKLGFQLCSEAARTPEAMLHYCRKLHSADGSNVPGAGWPPPA